MFNSNREKIIVILAAAVMLYGIYEYIFYAELPVQPKNTEETEDVLQCVSRISQELVQTSLTPFEKYLIEKTEKKWEDVFISVPLPKTEDLLKEELHKIKLPVYTGYLEMGNRMIAIINGTEYMTGDFLPGSGYELVRISPKEITVRSPKRELPPIPIATDEMAGLYEIKQKN